MIQRLRTSPVLLGTTATLTVLLVCATLSKVKGFHVWYPSCPWKTFSVLGSTRDKTEPPKSVIDKRNPESIPLPQELHRVVQASELKKKVLVIGDVHGCYDELQDLLELSGYTWNPSDWTLIFVGDLVNKGPKSAECIRFARESGSLCVRGNHDDSCIAAALKVGRYKDVKPGEYPPGKEYIKDLSSKDLNWLQNLPYTLHLPSLDAFVVHAGLVPGVPLPQQLIGDMTRMRNVDEGTPECNGNRKQMVNSNNTRRPLKGLETTSSGVPWVEKWHGPNHVYFGHDAKRQLQLAGKATGLDTGCCYGRFLTAVKLPENEIIQVPARKTYEVPGARIKIHK